MNFSFIILHHQPLPATTLKGFLAFLDLHRTHKLTSSCIFLAFPNIYHSSQLEMAVTKIENIVKLLIIVKHWWTFWTISKLSIIPQVVQIVEIVNIVKKKSTTKNCENCPKLSKFVEIVKTAKQIGDVMFLHNIKCLKGHSLWLTDLWGRSMYVKSKSTLQWVSDKFTLWADLGS